MKNKSKMEIDIFDNKKWKLPNGDLHREDGPAVEYRNGNKFWYLNNKRHREDGPAIEFTSGNIEWYLNGKRHRKNGPAIEYVDGYKFWYLNNRLYKIQDGDRIIKRDKDFDCKTCISQIVCNYDCQWEIIRDEYFHQPCLGRPISISDS